MTELFKNKNYDIKNVIFPGTHNSASKNILWNIKTESLTTTSFPTKTNFLTRFYISPWVCCQNLSITEQLIIGTRSFDLRIVYFENEWYVHHQYTCDLLKNVIKEFLNFMKITQLDFEFIFITLVTTTNYDPSIKSLLEPLENYLWNGKITNMDKMHENNEKIIIIWDSYNEKPFPSFISNYDYINTWIDKDIPSEKITFLKNQLFANNSKKWQNITFTLTPQTNTVIKLSIKNTFIPCSQNGVFALQNKLNPYLNELLKDKYISNCNIISCDYVNDEFIDQIFNLNQQFLNKSQ